MATASLRTFLKQLTQGMAAETLNEQTDRQLVEWFLARREEAAFEAIVPSYMMRFRRRGQFDLARNTAPSENPELTAPRSTGPGSGLEPGSASGPAARQGSAR